MIGLIWAGRGGDEKLTIHIISGPMRQMCIFFALIMEKTASGLDYHDWKFLKVREHVFVLIKGTSCFFFINQFAQVLESHTWININE